MTNDIHELCDGLSDFGYRIFLDRYSKKDMSGKVEEGQLVLAKIDGQKEIGTVEMLAEQDMTIVKFNDDEPAKPISISQLDVPIELSPRAMWARMAVTVADYEANEYGINVGKSFEEFMWLLEDWKFVPGGRILAGLGTDSDKTFYNCYVIPSPKDSKDGIFETANLMSQIMSRGGGVGINISSLRPRYARTFSTDGRSSGAVSWGEIYSFITGLIEQGGSRRGALMLIMDDWHPDIMEFIKIKQDMSRVLNANISIAVSDKLMNAVKNDEDWALLYPDTHWEGYDEKWDGDIHKWIREQGVGSFIVHSEVKARDLWDAIVESAWKSAEPGIWFKDRANELSNSGYYDPLICTNPCGEQGLPAWGVCNLGAINLAADEFIFDGDDLISAEVNWRALDKAIHLAVRFLDDVIDLTPHFLDEIKEQQQKERRIGLGTMGLADLLIKLELRYGSDEALKFVDKLYNFIAKKAYLASIELAKERGSFPAYDEAFRDQPFVRAFAIDYSDVENGLISYGIRNVTLLTQAPTGTTGTMVGVSTGIEPHYAWIYQRNSRLGTHVEYAKPYIDWCEKNNHDPIFTENILKQFEESNQAAITAQELTPAEHIAMQAAIQNWIDSSISKTCNVPNNYTVEAVDELYKLMYESGCKGGTIYRDGSRDKQVLELKSSMPSDDPGGPVRTLIWRTRPNTLHGVTRRIETPLGASYMVINHDDNGPFEVFVSVGKVGSAVAADAEGFGRLISLILRMPDGLSSLERLEAIVGQLGHIGTERSLGFGPNRVSSLPDAIATVLAEVFQLDEDKLPALPETANGDLCPGCGHSTLVRAEGCRKCFSCGHSEC